MKIFFTCCLFLSFFLNCFGQRQKDSLDVLREDFESFEYEKVITEANRLLNYKSLFSAEDLIDIYRMKGISLFSLADDSEAKDSFIEILKIDSTFNFDRARNSPKIVSFFDEVKADYLQHLLERQKYFDSVKKDTVYITRLVPDSQGNSSLRNSLIRSIIFPGLGHLYKGEKARGILLTSLSAVTLASSIYFTIKSNRKEKEYLAETDKNLISSKYNNFNSAYEFKSASYFAFAAVWLYSQIDLLLLSNNTSDSVLTNLPSFNYTSNGLQLSYIFNF